MQFNSDFFFQDQFFGGIPVVIQNKTVTAIPFDDLSPSNQGKLLGRPGNWSQFYFRTADITTPNPSDTFTVGTVIWRVDSVTAKGDVLEVLAESLMRKH